MIRRYRSLSLMAALAGCLATGLASAQELRVPVVGLVSLHAPELANHVGGIREELRRLGHVDGKTIRIDQHFTNGTGSAHARFSSRSSTEGSFLLSSRDRIVTAMAASKMPAVYGFREYVDAGGLVYYGANNRLELRRMAEYADRILNGAKPGDMLIQIATKFEMGHQRESRQDARHNNPRPHARARQRGDRMKLRAIRPDDFRSAPRTSGMRDEIVLASQVDRPEPERSRP
jgi:hypothetical protein